MRVSFCKAELLFRHLDQNYSFNSACRRLLLDISNGGGTSDTVYLRHSNLHNSTFSSQSGLSNSLTISQSQPLGTRFLTVGPHYSTQTSILAPFLEDIWQNKLTIETARPSIRAVQSTKFGHRSNTGTKLYQNLNVEPSVASFTSPKSTPRTRDDLFIPLSGCPSTHLSTFSNHDDSNCSEQALTSSSTITYLASPVRSKRESSYNLSRTSAIMAEIPLVVDTSLRDVHEAASPRMPYNVNNHVIRVRSPTSPLARVSPRPFS